MRIDLDLRVKLFKEYLENGGYERIQFKELLEGLIEVKSLPNGKVDPETVSPLVNAAMLAYEGSQLMPPFISDKHISEYQTLLQKSIFFEQINIETEKEFENVFGEFHKKPKVLFRGTNEARYRLYSSLQREWINNKFYNQNTSYEEFLKKLVANARKEQDGVLKKYFKNGGILPENDLAVLSFLQHHQCPTPLLDWTYDFSNALYFALDNLKQPTSKWEIDKYFSVYYLEEGFFLTGSLREIIDGAITLQLPKLKQELFEELGKEGVDLNKAENAYTEAKIRKLAYIMHGKSATTFLTKIEHLCKIPIAYFSDYDNKSMVHFFLNNNMNIANQQGAFTWNAHPTLPLEHIANEEYKKDNQNGEFIFCKCININKNLADYARKKLENLGVNKDYIYPDSYKIAKNSFEKTVEKNSSEPFLSG